MFPRWNQSGFINLCFIRCKVLMDYWNHLTESYEKWKFLETIISKKLLLEEFPFVEIGKSIESWYSSTMERATTIIFMHRVAEFVSRKKRISRERKKNQVWRREWRVKGVGGEVLWGFLSPTTGSFCRSPDKIKRTEWKDVAAYSPAVSRHYSTL